MEGRDDSLFVQERMMGGSVNGDGAEGNTGFARRQARQG